MTEPRQLDPERTAKNILAITKMLDEMPSEVRDLHNWLQDKLMPVVKAMHDEVSAAMFYVGMHEDRIAAIEESEGGGLDPEDHEMLLEYVKESLEVLKRMEAATSTKELKDLIKHGEECVEMLEEMAEEEEGPGDGAEH